MSFPEAVKIDILRDDAGVFSGVHELFWVFLSGDTTQAVVQVLTFPPDAADAPFNQKEDGYLYRMMFFASKPGIARAASTGGVAEDRADEMLLFLGTDGPRPEAPQQPCMHFLRIVRPNSDLEGRQPSYLDKGYVEEMWYARHRGLVRLEQRIDGTTSMTWSLSKFIPPH
jgi:hypothetical protein